MKLLTPNRTYYGRAAAALLIGAFLVLANAPAGAAEPSHVRDGLLAKKALAAAKKNNWTEYKRLASGLKNADMRAILRWNRMRSRKSGAGFHELTMFLKTRADWPRIARIRCISESMSCVASAKASPIPAIWWVGKVPERSPD